MSVFIVAEAGVNHLGDRAKMLALCDAAKAAGADAVKFQAYETWSLMARRGQLLESLPNEFGDSGSVPLPQHEDTFHALRQSQLSDADLDAIATHCKAIGIKWFASVFDPSQIERVLSRGACALKIGHAEADWEELYLACAKQPVATWVSGAADWCNVVGVWKYPADGEPPYLGDVGVAGRKGLSSHYTDYRIPAAAALRGAEYIEAHLMLGDGGLVGKTFKFSEPEAAWSLSPGDFAKMVTLIREYETWL